MSDKLKIKIHGYRKLPVLQELIDEFLRPSDYELLPDDGFRRDAAVHINLRESADKDEIKREIFDCLSELTGIRPDWGILTGVRPVKLAGEMLERSGDREAVFRTLTDADRLTENKASLILSVYERQDRLYGKADENSTGVYIGIPFCPTRCVYCSFASNQVGNEEIERYLTALHQEIRYAGRRLRESGMYPETVYFGGGTPTTLTAVQLHRLLETTKKSFDFSGVREFTVEAGRPDTITAEKLEVLKNFGVDRISINPQSMRQETLNTIGRSHTPEDIRRAFALAARTGFRVINADLIAGLPGEAEEDFRDSLRQVLELGANNVTVHTLAVKRASRLKDIDRDYHYRVANTVAAMLEDSREILGEHGFVPYYLYRQKHMAGFFENTGYCLGETDGLYNIRIMDEHQTIAALGAGGISKRYYPETNRLERVPNVTNYQEYIRRIDEMCARKENKLWR
ncbi:coproporphyrinogen dehydrogenase HemZ [Hornefia butyriciproducens]|uniref:coproporphyrinogen dehydrogenase HemZ n=1 Tax=Hornefia butyriciproducens TaxID=2652293 RepID=UPI002A90933C|nr:coproporphyrinogen dehydrogenase HemZ [Hornefia butyriciproducens]MDY5463405.1 coproporphyrinogen dehydrogenase HemZ [Hornefia butyriciproducens]